MASPRGAPVASVSTHSRPKAAEARSVVWAGHLLVSTHSRPKAADAVVEKSV